MKLKTIKLERERFIATITINRPEKLNALSTEVFEELRVCFRKLTSDFPNEVRGIVLTGAGDKAFVAGADIPAMSRMSPVEGESFARLAQETTEMIESLPLPVIACVNGYALGGGCELALACDYVFASQNAVFGQPEVSLGLIPGFGGCARLVRHVGPGRAREMIYTGKQISALEAKHLGIANEVFATKEQMLLHAERSIELMLLKSPTAIAISKQVVNDGWGKSTNEALAIELQGFRRAFETTEKAEGIQAFLEKRKPCFAF